MIVLGSARYFEYRSLELLRECRRRCHFSSIRVFVLLGVNDSACSSGLFPK